MIFQNNVFLSCWHLLIYLKNFFIRKIFTEGLPEELDKGGSIQSLLHLFLDKKNLYKIHISDFETQG